MWFFSQRARSHYQPVARSELPEDQEAALESQGLAPTVPTVQHVPEKHEWLLWAYFGISVLCLVAGLWCFVDQQGHRISDDRCLRVMSAPSPALEAVEMQWTTFDDTFQPDEYSGYPSKSSEAAWAKLWDFGAFSVPQHMLAGLNKSSMDGDFRLVGEEHGGGVGGLLEGAHQIHCLNLVRQFIYRNHWDYSRLPSFSGGEKTRRHHVDHCILTLRTVLTCLGDVTPAILEQSGSSQSGWVTRGMPRKCRVYQRLVNWVNDHSVFNTVE
ncbi:hypothetical protein VTK56DRAFT_809 [Thermocarpiscus australiensis]